MARPRSIGEGGSGHGWPLRIGGWRRARWFSSLSACRSGLGGHLLSYRPLKDRDVWSPEFVDQLLTPAPSPGQPVRGGTPPAAWSRRWRRSRPRAWSCASRQRGGAGRLERWCRERCAGSRAQRGRVALHVVPGAAMAPDLSPGDAARRSGLSRTLIYREIERGHLRAYRVGGRLRITEEALAEWKRLHAVIPRAQPPPYEPRPRASRGAPTSGGFAAELRAIREGSAA